MEINHKGMADRNDDDAAGDAASLVVRLVVRARKAVTLGLPLDEIRNRMRADPGVARVPHHHRDHHHDHDDADAGDDDAEDDDSHDDNGDDDDEDEDDSDDDEDADDGDGDLLLHWACRTRRARSEVLAAIADEWRPALQTRNSHGSLPIHVLLRSQPENEDAVRAVVRLCPACLKVRDKCGNYPLHVALQRQAPFEVIRLLVDGGPSALRQAGAHGSLPLHLAVRLSTVTVVEYLLDAYPDALRRKDQLGRLPLHRAADNDVPSAIRGGRFRPDEWPQVAGLVASRWRPALRVRDQSGFLPLHVAARDGGLQVASVLARADPRTIRRRTTKERWLPLHLLCQREYRMFEVHHALPVVDELVDMYVAALSLKDKNGWLPMHFAAGNPSLLPDDVVRRLVQRCPRAVRTRTADTQSFPLHLAAARRQTSSLELMQLLTRGHPPALGARDKDGRLPLHHGAAAGFSCAVVDFLADESGPLAFRQTDASGKLPLHLAAAATGFLGGTEVALVLRVCQEWPEALLEKDRSGRLPLHYAAQRGNLEVLRRFSEAAPASLQVATSVDDGDGSGSLPLHVAAAHATTYRRLASLEHLARAWTPGLDVPDAHGRRPFEVAASLPGALLDSVYLLLRLDPSALRRRPPGAFRAGLPPSANLAASTAASSAPAAGATAEAAGGVVDLRTGCAARPARCVVL